MLPGRGRSAANSATRLPAAWWANRARRSSGPVTIRDRAWLMVPIRSDRAVRLDGHQRPDRLHLPVAPFRRAGRPAGQSGPGRADRIQRIGLAPAAPVLAVGTVHLNDPDAGRGDVPGEPGAVTAGPFDADQAHRPEPAEPLHQA